MAHTLRVELLRKLEVATAIIKKDEVWQHTKTKGRYVIIGIGINEGNEDIQVEYRELDHEPPITWHRSFDGKDGWIVPTEIEGLPAPRFTKIQ